MREVSLDISARISELDIKRYSCKSKRDASETAEEIVKS